MTRIIRGSWPNGAVAIVSDEHGHRYLFPGGRTEPVPPQPMPSTPWEERIAETITGQGKPLAD